MMRFIPVILMSMAVGLSPIAAFANNWFVVSVICNLVAFVATVYVTFENDIYRQPEGKLASSILWAMFVVQLAWAIV